MRCLITVEMESPVVTNAGLLHVPLPRQTPVGSPETVLFQKHDLHRERP